MNAHFSPLRAKFQKSTNTADTKPLITRSSATPDWPAWWARASTNSAIPRPKMNRTCVPLIDRTELTRERIAIVRNHPAPVLTTRSARSFCSTKFVRVREDCGVLLRPKPGVDIKFLQQTVLAWREVG